MIAGLPASVVTDRVQGVMITGFMLLFSCVVLAKNEVTATQMRAVSKSTTNGFVVMITLIIAILGAELFNAGQWQRVYAARSTQDLRKGLALGAGMIFVVMWFFGILGVTAAAKYRADFDELLQVPLPCVLRTRRRSRKGLARNHSDFCHLALREFGGFHPKRLNFCVIP